MEVEGKEGLYSVCSFMRRGYDVQAGSARNSVLRDIHGLRHIDTFGHFLPQGFKAIDPTLA